MPNLAFLLTGTESPVNLGYCLRGAEAAGLGPVYFHDEQSLFEKSKDRHTIERVSRGALKHKGIEMIDNPHGFLGQNERGYRRIATVIDDPSAANLYDFEFNQEGDLLVLGSESLGLDDKLIGLCDERITIPREVPSQCYSLVLAFSIFIGEYMSQRHREEKAQQHPNKIIDLFTAFQSRIRGRRVASRE